MDRVEQGWIGIDAGKGHHHAVLIDRDGQRLLSRRVINDQPDLVALIDTVQDRVVDPVWAIDLAAGSASLVIGASRDPLPPPGRHPPTGMGGGTAQ
jgi:hypothetical protein